MNKPLISALLAATFAVTAWAKLPPAPPADPKAVEEKAAKDKAAAEKAKAQQGVAEDRAVKNFQANMKKAGKPVPKPTVIAAAPPAPPAPPAKAAEPAKPKK